MQLKKEAMQLIVGMQNNIWGKRINKGYMFTLFLSSFLFTLFILLIRGENNLSYLYQKVLRIKLKCGLVYELTLRVNRHSNGQESPLSHHYVF